VASESPKPALWTAEDVDRIQVIRECPVCKASPWELGTATYGVMCQKCYSRAYRQSHAEERREYSRKYSRAYRRAHRDEIREYRRAHTEEIRKYNREYRQAHTEKYREYSRKYHRAHREERREYSREYYRTNTEERRKSIREYRRANAGAIREREREYRRAHPEEHRASTHRRRTRIAASREAMTPEQIRLQVQRLKDIQAQPCAYCGGPYEHADHYIPVSHGGSSQWWNYVSSCAACNLGKADRWPWEFMTAERGCE
jgi:hypothetical protein